MIYFLQPTTGGAIKIGYTENLAARHKQLEAHYGQPLALLATLPGGRDEEWYLHERFAEHRLGRTEQFRPVAEIMAFIGRPLLVGADPDAVEAMTTTNERCGVRLADDVVADAKVLASMRDISMAELLSDMLEPMLKKALDAEYRKRLEKGAKGD